jgi:hypothetical protein
MFGAAETEPETRSDLGDSDSQGGHVEREL